MSGQLVGRVRSGRHSRSGRDARRQERLVRDLAREHRWSDAESGTPRVSSAGASFAPHASSGSSSGASSAPGASSAASVSSAPDTTSSAMGGLLAIVDTLKCKKCKRYCKQWASMPCGHSVCYGCGGGSLSYLSTCPLCDEGLMGRTAKNLAINDFAAKMSKVVCQCTFLNDAEDPPVHMRGDGHTCEVEWSECPRPECGDVYATSAGHVCPFTPCRGHAICKKRGADHVYLCYFDSKIPLTTHVLEKFEAEMTKALSQSKQLREEVAGRKTNTPVGIRRHTKDLIMATHHVISRTTPVLEHLRTLRDEMERNDIMEEDSSGEEIGDEVEEISGMESALEIDEE